MSETPYLKMESLTAQIKKNLEQIRDALPRFAALQDQAAINEERMTINRMIQDATRAIANLKRQPDCNRVTTGVLESSLADLQTRFRGMMDKKRAMALEPSARPGPSAPYLSSEDPEARRQRLMQEDAERQAQEAEERARREEEARRRQKQDEISFQLGLVEQRTQNIRELHQEIRAVNEATRDLAVMVNEDTEKLELLSMTAQNIANNTAEGQKQVSQANALDKKARTKLCCVLLLVLLDCAVLIFIFVFFRKEIFGG